ncbi:MAG: hypothetical protein ACT4OO_06760 [Nitrospiraceae bacterium]
MMSDIQIPNVFPYLVAILGLLAMWQFHQIQVMKGSILAIDIFDRSGVRLYLHVVPNEKSVCETCRQANGKVFLPSEVIGKNFTPLDKPCTNSRGCGGLLVGLYGAWPEARHLVERLRTIRKKTRVQLSGPEIASLIGGPWERCISADTDRIAVHVLEAMHYEDTNPETSITNYRYLIDQAREVRHLSYVIPTYFRLVELLARQGRADEAIEAIERFEGRYKGKKAGPLAPTETQMGIMSMKKARLGAGLKQAS